MHFSIIPIVAALAVTATAQYVPTNGTATATTSAFYPIGTGAGSASGTAASSGSKPASTSTAPFTGGASTNMAGSALGLVVAGGVALVSFFLPRAPNPNISLTIKQML
jgi:hypothetical protein